MASIEGALLDFRRLDRLAAGDSTLHRLDARAKLLVTLIFTICVVSFDRYELSALVPFFIFPAVMISVGDLPSRYLAGKVALVSPFALAVGIFNPMTDQTILMQCGPFAVSGGWISCASIVIRAVLTVSAAMILVAVTGFPSVCRALERLGMPKAFTMQLLLLYRYLLLLTEEGGRASRARELRSFGQKGRGMGSYVPLLGNLLLRALHRGDRVHMSMLARGFSGSTRSCDGARFSISDSVFVLGWSALFIILRFTNISQFLGLLVTGS